MRLSLVDHHRLTSRHATNHDAALLLDGFQWERVEAALLQFDLCFLRVLMRKQVANQVHVLNKTGPLALHGEREPEAFQSQPRRLVNVADRFHLPAAKLRNKNEMAA